MTPDQPETRETEAERVARWRLEQLVRAGFDEAAALLVAAKRTSPLEPRDSY